MWKFLYFIVILVCPNNLLADEFNKTLHEKCIYPTILISNKDSYGSGAIAKCIKLDKEYLNFFITCNHIIHHGNYTVIVFDYENSKIISGNEYKCLFYAKNPKLDLAVGAFISPKPMPIVDLGIEEKLYIGSVVSSVGCGAGDYPRFEEGKINAIQSKFFEKVRSSLHVIPGDSGGPVFHKNKLVGVVNSIRTWKDHFVFSTSFFTPLSDLEMWSKENNQFLAFLWLNNDYPKLIYHKLKLKDAYK